MRILGFIYKLVLLSLIIFSIVFISISFSYIVHDMRTEDIFSNMNDATFLVQTYDSYGTAFKASYKDKTYLITAWHVCRNSIDTGDVIIDEKRVKILSYDLNTDICILDSTGFDNYKSLKLADKVNLFSKVYTLGYPDLSLNISEGRLISQIEVNSKIEKLYSDIDILRCYTEYDAEPIDSVDGYYCTKKRLYIYSSLIINFGASGSAVVNSLSEVVGLVASKDSNNNAYIIHVDNIVNLIEGHNK